MLYVDQILPMTPPRSLCNPVPRVAHRSLWWSHVALMKAAGKIQFLCDSFTWTWPGQETTGFDSSLPFSPPWNKEQTQTLETYREYSCWMMKKNHLSTDLTLEKILNFFTDFHRPHSLILRLIQKSAWLGSKFKPHYPKISASIHF